MRKLSLLLPALACAACSSGVPHSAVSAKLDDPPDPGPLVVPRPDAIATSEPSDDAAEVLFGIRGYQSWDTFPENRTPKRSAAHNQMFVVAHFNDVVRAAMIERANPLPDGSTIVKENLRTQDRSSLVALTIMSKRDGQWFWLEATPDNRVVALPDGTILEGKALSACTGCHNQAVTNDSIFTHDLSR